MNRPDRIPQGWLEGPYQQQADDDARAYAQDMVWAEEAKDRMPELLADLELVSDLTENLVYRDGDHTCQPAARCLRAVLGGDHAEVGRMLAEIMAASLADMAWRDVTATGLALRCDPLDTADRDAQRAVLQEARRLLHVGGGK